jgi:hypothetical protein
VAIGKANSLGQFTIWEREEDTMKKILIPMMLVMLTVLVSVAMADQTAKPKVVYGTYSSLEDFTVNFWMEKFEGGGPGQEGNVLFAAGQGFIFKDATLAEVSSCSTSQEGIVECYTTYIGGELLLNSDGPWIKKEKEEHKQGGLRATDITAINTSTLNTSTGELNFTLTFSGSFDNNDAACYSVTAEYLGNPILIPDASNPILQKDDHFTEVIIDIQKCGKSKGKD